MVTVKYQNIIDRKSYFNRHHTVIPTCLLLNLEVYSKYVWCLLERYNYGKRVS